MLEEKNLFCPFDKFQLSHSSEFPDMSGWICSNSHCNLTYSMTADQDQINAESKKYIEKWKEKLITLKKEEKDLLDKVRKAEQAGLLGISWRYKYQNKE